MNSIIKIDGWVLEQCPGEPRRIQDLELARRLGYSEPKAIRKLISRMITAGQLADVLDRGPAWDAVSRAEPEAERHPAFAGKRGAAEPDHDYWLTRNQALKVSARSETPPADALLDEMIHVFEMAIDGALPLPPVQKYSFEDRSRAAGVIARAVGEILGLAPQSVAASLLEFGRREAGLELPGLTPDLPEVGESKTCEQLASELGTNKQKLGKLIKSWGIQDNPEYCTKVLLGVNGGRKQVSQFLYNAAGLAEARRRWTEQ